jgi:glycine C-acetyltransferase
MNQRKGKMKHTFKEFLSNEYTKFGAPSWRVLESSQGARVRINNEWKISMCSNNYLGFANHPILKEAAIKALEEYGIGTVASRSLSGSTPLHEALETELANFKGTESALVFNSGFVANTGVIPALAGKGDAIFSDEINHASIVDGCRLSGAEKYRYNHGDMAHLEHLLKTNIHHQKKMIITDAIFSMDGDIAPMGEIVRLCEEYDAFLMVDEAHATGVLGKNGRGAVEQFGLEVKVDVIMGTLGKALGSVGGYIAGDRELIAYLARTARSFIFTTSLPPSCIAAALAGLRYLGDHPELMEKLWQNTNYFESSLSKLGINTMGSKTPIVPILIGEDDVAKRFSQRIYDEGLLSTKIGSPYVPVGTSRVRTILTAVHTREDLEEAVSILKKVGQEFNIIP